jgi:hypothetical protein
MDAKMKSENQNCRRFRERIEELAAEPKLRLNAALARHVDTCPACRSRLDEITGVQFLLDRAKWQAMPAGTLALCNRQAMKKLQTRTRESAKGQELAIAKPDLPLWQHTAVRFSRGGIGVAAGLALLIFNWTISGGLDLTRHQLQQLADAHQRQQIGDWSDPINSKLT